MAVDFDALLTRKYGILQQQADADTQRAAATTLTAGAAANLDRTRAGILPSESAAAIALQRAQTLLTGNQAQTVIPESQAKIGLMGSEVGLNNANVGLIGQNTLLAKHRNREITILPESLKAVMGNTNVGGLGSSGFLSSDPLPAKRIGESQAAYTDRINGL